MALKALVPGAKISAPTATPMTAIAATTATGKTMPKRRIRPRFRRLLRAPVRCRDKAVLSFGHARVTLERCSVHSCVRPRACAVTGAAPPTAAPDLVRLLARLAQVPLAHKNARKRA